MWCPFAGHMVTAEEARNLVRNAGLKDDEIADILLEINTAPDATLCVFEGLQANEVKAVVLKYLNRLKAGENDFLTLQTMRSPS